MDEEYDTKNCEVCSKLTAGQKCPRPESWQ